MAALKVVADGVFGPGRTECGELAPVCTKDDATSHDEEYDDHEEDLWSRGRSRPSEHMQSCKVRLGSVGLLPPLPLIMTVCFAGKRIVG